MPILRLRYCAIIIILFYAGCKNDSNKYSANKDDSVQIVITSDEEFSNPIHWVADITHSSVQFKSRHTTVHDVIGWIESFDINITAQKFDFSDSKVEATFDMTSIKMPNQMMAGSLQRTEWFNTANYPTSRFVSKDISYYSKNKFKITGDFTIKDITKEITLDATLNGFAKPMVHGLPGFTIDGKFSRFDYGLSSNEKLEKGGVPMWDDTIYFTANLRLYVAKDH